MIKYIIIRFISPQYEQIKILQFKSDVADQLMTFAVWLLVTKMQCNAVPRLRYGVWTSDMVTKDRT